MADLTKLTPEDQIFLLQQELEQAVHAIEFMYDCLTDPEHAKFAYPEMTQRELTEFKQYIPKESLCEHRFSAHRLHPECDICNKAVADMIRLTEIRKQLET